MRDLLTCDLGDVTIDDVAAFLGLDAAPDDRPSEGAQIDYKEDVPQDIGNDVCALANTFGGLLILGVKEEEGRPTGIVGVARKGSGDLKTRIANMLRTTVHPRPPFEVQVLSAPQIHPECEIAIVRVREGDWPPYMFRNAKVSVRVEDTTSPASYSDLESLFQRREDATGADSANRLLPGPELRATTLGPDNQRVDSDRFARIWIRPVRPLRLVLDRGEESSVCKTLREIFPVNILVKHRDSTSFEVKIGDGWPQLTWRSLDDGSQGTAANISAANHPHGVEAYLALAADRWIRTCRAAATILEGYNWLGRVTIRSDLVLGRGRVTDSAIEGVTLAGLAGLDGMAPQREGFTIDLVGSHADLENPARLVGELLVRHLRELRGMDADLDALTKSLAKACGRIPSA